MERPLKQRLIGGAVLIALAVIFVPMLLHKPHPGDAMFGAPAVPPKPNWVLTPPRAATGPLPTPSSAAQPQAPVIVGATPPHASAPAAHGDGAHPAAPGAQATVPPAQSNSTTAPTPSPKASAPAGGAGAPAVAARPGAPLHSWVVQVASLSSARAAETLRDKLRKAGFAAFLERVRVDGRVVFRVRVGPELERARAQALLQRLRDERHLRGIVVAYP